MQEISLSLENVMLFVGLLFDIVGVAAIVIGFILATVRLLSSSRAREPNQEAQAKRVDTSRQYRIAIGRALLLALEILVAADIIRTVAVELTLQNLLALGLLVLIRTFLSWSLAVEVDGHFPWQRTLTAEDS